MLKAIGSTSFKTEEAYLAYFHSRIEEFSAPPKHSIDLKTSDTVDIITTKINFIPLIPSHGSVLHLWIRGVIVNKDADLDVPLWHKLQEAVDTLYHDGLLTCKTKLHLVGQKLTPPHGMHPKMLQNILDGRLRVPTPYRVYRGGEEMTEITITMSADGSCGVVSGMQFPLSNFRPILCKDGQTYLTLGELGVTAKDGSWKWPVIKAPMDSAEKQIQLIKAAAALGTTYRVTDVKVIRSKMADRLKVLRNLAPASLFNTVLGMSEGEMVQLDLLHQHVSAGTVPELLDEDLILFNDAISAKLLEAMVACVVPGDEKDIGRAALINGAAYFPQMDGAPFDPAASNFDTVGVNAVLMAVGLMLRIYRGDAQLIDSLEVCRRFNLRIQEAAVHVQVKGENGVKLTHGHVPDTKWGSEGDCTRDSPDFDEAVVMMAPWTDADGTVTSAPEPVHGAFAAGSSMTMAAMFGDGEVARAARVRLGCNPDQPMLITEETCRLAATKMLAEIAE
jgi:hypothetical protein